MPRSPTNVSYSQAAALYKLVAVRFFCGLDNFFIGGVAPAVADVLHERAMKEYGLLRHKADGVAQAVLRYLGDVLLVYSLNSPSDVVETQQKLGDGRLARARRPHERNLLAARNREIKVLQNRPLG